jgi:cysteine desulfurase
MTSSFIDLLSEQLGGITLNGHPVQRLPGTVNLAFSGMNGATLVQALDMAGVATSPGSACQSGAAEPSHVLAAMGLSDDVARGSVRFSFGRTNEESQVGRAVEIVVRTVAGMRSRTGSYAA